ncbi:MAG: LysR family transcriptional regulator [Alphaproteobacteria bacterium]|nr:LysR family transcriptional regulator [Alphaproteobacteria bacterium]
MPLEPRQLMHLAIIADHGSFSRAAAAMNISQPALSSSIAQLERSVGARVLDRGRQGAKLTDVGSALVRHARALQLQLAHAAEEAHLRTLGGDGPLRIGVTPVTAANLVPQALGRLQRETPNISVSVLEGLDEQMTALHDGEVEIVVGPIAVNPASRALIEEPLVNDPLGVVVRARNRLARRRSLSLRDLRDVSWALPSERSAFRRQLEALFVTAGVPWPTLCLTTNSMTALKAIVANSDAITIMPRRLVTLEIGSRLLASVPLRDTGRERTLGMTWLRRRELSPIAQRFATVLRAVAREDETC